MTDAATWQALAAQIRVDSIRVSTEAGSGHPSSSLSATDLIAVLASSYLKYDFDNPQNPLNDKLVFSKGHASPLLYSLYRVAGAIDEAEFLTYRRLNSRLEGHPTPRLPWVDVATGSLGQGLSIGAGMALVAKRLEKSPIHVWVLLGDSEMAEGSVWEAADLASYYNLTNLVAIVDVNRLGQRGETEFGWDLNVYADRARAFGWNAIEIDGHDYAAIAGAYDQALAADKPTMIIARTVKGKGLTLMENKADWHGKALPKDMLADAIAELGGDQNVTVAVAKPDKAPVFDPGKDTAITLPTYEVGKEFATRQVYGEALAAVGNARPRVVALDAEVSNSTYSDIFAKAHPERFFEMFIAEQRMVGAAVGMQTRGWLPFASTFAAFQTRAYDFIRVAAISQANLKLSGSHAGVSIGEDGPSQMALEDLAMMRAITGSVVLYPSEATSTAALIAAMTDDTGISYIRTTREKTPTLYGADKVFKIGGSEVLRQSDADRATIVAAGVTVFEALAAADQLAKDGIAVRVIDAYSIKPIDTETLHAAAQATGVVVTVEDHRPEGGLGEAVQDAFTGPDSPRPVVVKLAVRELPGSGTPQELRAGAGIDAAAIVKAVKQLV